MLLQTHPRKLILFVELNLKPISIDEFMSLAGALDMPDILKLTSRMQAEKPLGKD